MSLLTSFSCSSIFSSPCNLNSCFAVAKFLAYLEFELEQLVRNKSGNIKNKIFFMLLNVLLMFIIRVLIYSGRPFFPFLGAYDVCNIFHPSSVLVQVADALVA